MEKEITVSVIIPARNEERNIGRLLESIKKQTYKNIEIIVVDDGSSDKTFQIAQKYTPKVFKRTFSERSAQRNFGAIKSMGSYLIFLDADMELTPKVIEDCLNVLKKTKTKILTIPETTVENTFLSKVRKFERKMYINEIDYEVPRVFERELFFKHKGYDENLTGPEDYDLPYRMGKNNKIVRSNEYLFHHEEDLTLVKLLRKKYYYAKKGANYATKHPSLVKKQGTILFRKVYLKNWKSFIKHPVLGVSFIFIRLLETIWAVSGFISAIGILGFIKVFLQMFK